MQGRRAPRKEASPDGRGRAGRVLPSPTTTRLERRTSMSEVRNVALVHGGFVDGSGWEGVYHLLRQDGFNVSIVQNPTVSLDGDVETTLQVLDRQDGPTILVGHSYGGVVITEAGTHDNVAGLVYIAAFAPAEGESV